MYLVSIYFDKKSENQIQTYINDVAKQCGNTFMIENNVPPHITVSAFETLRENAAVDALDVAISDVKQNMIELVTVGTFPTVIFIQPVLNEYLHNLATSIFESIVDIPDTVVSKYYKPFSWLPHVTIAKQLSEDEVRVAFDVLQKTFGVFEGNVVRIELAKKNPYRVIESWELNHE